MDFFINQPSQTFAFFLQRALHFKTQVHLLESKHIKTLQKPKITKLEKKKEYK